MQLKRFQSIVKFNVFFIFFYFIFSMSIVLAYHSKGESVNRTIQYNFTIQNPTNQIIRDATFWTYAPASKPGSQELLKVTSNQTYQMTSDDTGNSILSYRFQQLSPFETKMIYIQTTVQMTISGQSQKVLSENNETIFLLPEPNIESNAPGIVRTAQQLKQKNAYETSKKIHLWVADYLKYIGYIKNDRGALWAFENKKGDCTEFMYLFVALCRAAAIPARGIAGYMVTDNKQVLATDYHNWAECHINGQWRVADPQQRNFMQNEDQYVAMRIISHVTTNPIGKYHRFRCSNKQLKIMMKQ